MKVSPPKFVFFLAVLGTVAVSATAAHAQYAFTKIADTTTATPVGGTFGSPGVPGLSSGNVTFAGSYTGGTGTTGVFRGSGGALTAIATNGSAQAPGGTFSSFNTPSISGSTAAFRGSYTGTGTQGIFMGSGGALTAIATDGSAQVPGGGTFSSSFGSSPSIIGSTVAFSGSYTGGTGTTGIFTGSGGALTAIARGGAGASATAPGGGTFSVFSNPSLSGSTAVFRGTYTGGTGTTGIFTGSGGALTSIASDSSAQVPGGGTFSSFGTPGLSGSTAAFLGNYTGGTGTQGIFIGSGGALTAIATNGSAQVPGGGTFSSFGTADISGSQVAFRGSYTGGTGTLGIFVGFGGSLSKVITDADTLFGSTVTSVNIGGFSQDGTSVAFNYALANGSSGVALATLTSVPEPGSLALLAIGGIAGVGAVRRRRK